MAKKPKKKPVATARDVYGQEIRHNMVFMEEASHISDAAIMAMSARCPPHMADAGGHMTASEVGRQHHEMIMANEEEYRRRGRHYRNGYEVRIERNNTQGRLDVIVHHPDDRTTNMPLDPRDVETMEREPNFLRHLARQHAQIATEDMERHIFESMVIAVDRQRGMGHMMERRAGAWERMREHLGDGINHGLDVARGAIDGPREKPVQAEVIDALVPYPAVIEIAGFRAELLNDTMKLWAESDVMRHCLYKSYTTRIQGGRYVVYHVTPPLNFAGLKKSGYTLGFERDGSGGWSQDQIKGTANSRPDSRELEHFARHVGEEINKIAKSTGGNNGHPDIKIKRADNGDGHGERVIRRGRSPWAINPFV